MNCIKGRLIGLRGSLQFFLDGLRKKSFDGKYYIYRGRSSLGGLYHTNLSTVRIGDEDESSLGGFYKKSFNRIGDESSLGGLHKKSFNHN